ARMRGDDLGPVLANADAEGPRFAFSEVSDARMMTDGRFKTICAIGSGVFGAEAEAMRCRLYDLANDPDERVNVASEHPDETRALRSAIHRLIASIPRVEALAMGGKTQWPKALARGALGDLSAAPMIVPLLGDSRPAVRAEAA